MPCSTDSRASSPARFSYGSESDETDTPFTERSLLFGDDDIDTALQKPVNGEYILVVGGCGFIGSHTVWELQKAGHNVFTSTLLLPRDKKLTIEFSGCGY
jgi:UDP-glucose 4-epimerase